MKYRLIAILFFVVIVTSGCLYNFSSQDTQKAYFDMGHHEIFSPNNGDPSSYTELYYKLQEQGFDVEVVVDPLTSEVLSDADILVIGGPMIEFSTQEIDDIRDFVRGGGNLLLLVHIFPPVVDLIDDFGIACSTYIVHDVENQINISPRDFYSLDIENHPITEGVEEIAVFGSWSLASVEPANVVAWSSDRAWLDTNANQVFDVDFEVQGRLGVVAVSEYGSGKVVVLDDAVFTDGFVVVGDNRVLRDNIISWFKEDGEL